MKHSYKAFIGRPPLPKAMRRSKFVIVRLTAGELLRVKQTAKDSGKRLSVWTRQRLLL